MRPLPLRDIRVLDLGQFIAMPFCTQWLAWLGAEVIVVESRRHLTSRGAPPFAVGQEGDPNATGYFNLLYGRKKSCLIDLTTAAGRELVKRLAAVSDVMVDNFSTGVLEKLELGYDTVRRIRPDIVMLSCSAFGRTGPMRDAKGFHSAVNLFSGVSDVTGYPGGQPRILGGCLPDPFGGVASVFAVLAALHHRRRTGQGQYIDLAMYEVMLSAIPEAVIAYTMCGLEPVRTGSRHPVKVPHGIYRCRDADTWVALSVDDDIMWRRFCDAIGHPEWTVDARFADASARRANEGALDEGIGHWTRGRPLGEVTAILQQAGIAAGPVLRADQLLVDRQLCERGTVIENDHPVGGRHRQIGLPWRMDTVGVEYCRAPLLGEHTHEVLTKLLGLSDAEYARLGTEGVLS
jgi:crotonobetainyl-CoA:carnitine CoA-transferase CaiB-like acyl-CoA transferase